MDATICRFWWKPKQEAGKYLAWRAWDDLCCPKAAGGLGFQRSKLFNQALLLKLAWMVVSSHESPCMVALRSKYKVSGDWLKKDPIKSASSTWRAIENIKSCIYKGACYIIGDGSGVDCWKDPWVPWLPSFTPKPKNCLISTDPLLVSTLINSETNTWRNATVEEFFDLDSAAAIAKIPIPFFPRPDKLTWIADSKGIFCVKSAYKVFANHLWPPNPTPVWQRLWKLKIHERFFFYQKRIEKSTRSMKD